MRNRILTIISGLLIAFLVGADTIPSNISMPLQWRFGAEISQSWVPGTNRYLKGENELDKRIDKAFSGSLRADFGYNPKSRMGQLYKGAYQGLGVGLESFFEPSLLGNPVSIYIYQGAPVVHFSQRFFMNYEWQFGAAMGWKHFSQDDIFNSSVSTAVTAHMGLSVKFSYLLSTHWQISAGVSVNHFSNGNTSWPNGGVNTLGANLGVAYIINPQRKSTPANEEIFKEADCHRWFYDICVYGAWRKRIVMVGTPLEPELCPGRFGVVGMQFSPLYRLNRYVSVGPSVDLQWDESAGLQPYWIEGSHNENILFERPPFGRQISAGVSGHAELTMPIFSINAGVGFDMVSPKGNKRFYQSLALKTFITSKLYINVGYRLGNFDVPQNLMLGVGIRL